MALGSNSLVIRRIKKVKKGGKHGGAWKIALADFALAMMALFMVLWILSVASPEQRASIEGYFNDPLGQSTAGFSASPIDLGGSPAKTTQQRIDLQQPEEGSADRREKKQTTDAESKSDEEIKEINEAVQEELKKMNLVVSQQENLRIEITPQGVRITLLEEPDKPMFERGSARMLPDVENMLLSLAPVFTGVNNPISITGHTDSTVFNNVNRLDNWDLSAMRANAARRIVEEGGVQRNRVAQVIGLADTIPYNRFDLDSPENRRISITLLTDEAYKAILDRNRLNFGSPVEQADLDLEPNQIF
ncbi:flagellar motor protein MotB [Marinomonas transparens]|uniref:OmpA family protein n=1 Tax=Marinomonas transparens TaxID=2795388 RepID=A0A934N5Z0_9GAMM|nr:flagellar motor protein MotB [Marinomonas transparens]MBJ7537536.1 OmpA family protein [Marinomonas transparens]